MGLLVMAAFAYGEIPQKNDVPQPSPVKSSFSQNFLSKKSWGRPDLPETYISQKGHFKLHYTISGTDAVPTETNNPDGVPDWIYNAANYAERAYHVLVDSMGFDAPPFDGVDGDEYDIYFKNWGGNPYANTYPENPVENTSRPKDYTTYLVVDNDFVENSYATRGFEALKVTVSHEFFHMVQIGYNFNTSNYLSQMYSGDAFFFEWSSTWFEEFMYPEVNDYVAYAKNFMYSVDSPIWSYNNSFEYAQGIFLKFIIDRYSTNILVKTWNKIKSGERAYFAIDDVIKDETNTTLAELYNEYCQRMYFSGALYDLELSVSEDAQYFPPMHIHWSHEYEFNNSLEINDYINYVTTLPIQITFENSQYFGIINSDDFSKELLGRYIYIKNGKYSINQFDLKADEFVGISSLEDTLLLFITNINENAAIELKIELNYIAPVNMFSFSKLYPNPTNGPLNLSVTTKNTGDGIQLKIFNLLGQELMRKKYNHQDNNLYSISLNHEFGQPLPSGTYIIQVESGGKFKTQKFTILK